MYVNVSHMYSWLWPRKLSQMKIVETATVEKSAAHVVVAVAQKIGLVGIKARDEVAERLHEPVGVVVYADVPAGVRECAVECAPSRNVFVPAMAATGGSSMTNNYLLVATDP